MLAASGGLELASHLDASEDDRYEPVLQLLISAWAPDAAPLSRASASKATTAPKT